MGKNVFDGATRLQDTKLRPHAGDYHNPEKMQFIDGESVNAKLAIGHPVVSNDGHYFDPHNVYANIEIKFDGKRNDTFMTVEFFDQTNEPGNPTPVMTKEFSMKTPIAKMTEAVVNDIEAGALHPVHALAVLQAATKYHLQNATQQFGHDHNDSALRHTSEAMVAQTMAQGVRMSKDTTEALSHLKGGKERARD